MLSNLWNNVSAPTPHSPQDGLAECRLLVCIAGLGVLGLTIYLGAFSAQV